MKYVQNWCLLHLRPIVPTNDQVTDSQWKEVDFDAGEDIDDLQNCVKQISTSKNGCKGSEKYKTTIIWLKNKKIEEKDPSANWQPPISGKRRENFNLPIEMVGNFKISYKMLFDGIIRMIMKVHITIYYWLFIGIINTYNILSLVGGTCPDLCRVLRIRNSTPKK